MSQMIGAVIIKRCRPLVSEGRELVERASRCQFKIGDQSLEIEPMRPRSGPAPADRGTVEESRGRFAADLDVSLEMGKHYRWGAARWPKDERAVKVSHR